MDTNYRTISGTNRSGIQQSLSYGRHQNCLYTINRSVFLIVFVWVLFYLTTMTVSTGVTTTTVRTIIPVRYPTCPTEEKPKHTFFSFVNKPEAERCPNVIKKLTPSSIVFYANVISSSVLVLILLIVLAATYITVLNGRDEAITSRIGSIVNHYVRNYRVDAGTEL